MEQIFGLFAFAYLMFILHKMAFLLFKIESIEKKGHFDSSEFWWHLMATTGTSMYFFPIFLTDKFENEILEKLRIQRNRYTKKFWFMLLSIILVPLLLGWI